MKRRVFCLSLLAVSACGTPGAVVLSPNSTIYVVRHSDRNGENLNEKGLERSEALVDALADRPLDAIYSPGIQRNLDTAAPISQARGIEVSRRPQEAPTARLAREAKGRAVLWVGNKGNIATIWEDLRLPNPAPLEYGDLFIVRSDETGTVTVERLFFGPQ